MPKEIAEAVARSALAGAIGEITHKFLTEDEKRFISLAREFIAISESAYSIWGNFRREVIVAKTALEKVHRPAFYSRIGLRYQDVVDKDGLGLGAEPWDALINSPLVGLLAEEGTKDYVRGIAGEVLISVDDGVKGGFVRLRHGLTAHDGRQVYAIDADFFTEEKNGSEDVLGVLDKFNKLAGCLFRWAITPRLHRALAPVAAE